MSASMYPLSGQYAATPSLVSADFLASQAFYAALNDCHNPSVQPHPVHARNIHLMQSWERWSLQLNRRADEVLADRGIRWQEIINWTDEMIRADAQRQPGLISLPPDLSYLKAMVQTVMASVLFWRWQHTLLELTPALEQLLVRSDLGADIPADYLRPPVPACFIRFGQELQQSIMPLQVEGFRYKNVEGAYVFEVLRNGKRMITLAIVYADADRPKRSVGSIEMVIDDEQCPLTELIQRIPDNNPTETWPHYQSIAQLCIKVFLYLNVAQAQRIVETPYTEAVQQLERIGPKKAAKVRRQVDRLYDRVLLGPQVLPGHLVGEHGEVSPHWRRGHFRMQPHGPQMSLRKVMFIAPTLVRADRLESAA